MPIASIFNYIGVIVLVVLVLILVVSNIHVVQQSRAYVVERLGAYSATWNVGLHLKIPFIERVVKKRQPQGAGRRLRSPARHHQG